jgi:dehydrogenase/reductase SDR family protein 12
MKNCPAPQIRALDRWLDRCILPGMLMFSKYGYSLSKKRWRPPAPSLKNKTVIVTGATSGLGQATALGMARLGAKTIVVGRNAPKIDTVCRNIIEKTGNFEVRGEKADLSLKTDIRALARRLDQKERTIYALINNAGALFDQRQETAGRYRTLFCT